MKKTIYVLLIFAAFPMLVKATTIIDFEQLGAGGDDGFTYLGTSSYNEDGFTLMTQYSSTQQPSQFYFMRNTISNSLALGTQFQSDVITLTQDNGQPFSLISVVYAHVHSTAIQFTGMRSDSTQVTFTKNFDSQNVFSTITFSGFNDLIWVSWSNGGGYNNFDDITIVPEPISFSLLIIGIWGLRRKLHS